MNYFYWALGIAIVWFLSHQAGRLDRLHHRIDVTEAALDGHLGRRAGIVAELSNVSTLDPVTSAVLAQVSHDALAAEPHELIVRIEIENELSDVLADTFGDEQDVLELISDPVARQLMNELAIVCARVNLSHAFHTEAVGDCINLRRQWIVRIFHLAGHAQLPTTFKLHSDVPTGLVD